MQILNRYVTSWESKIGDDDSNEQVGVEAYGAMMNNLTLCLSTKMMIYVLELTTNEINFTELSASRCGLRVKIRLGDRHPLHRRSKEG